MNTKLLAKRTFIQASIATLVLLLAWIVVSSSKILLTGFGGILIAVLFFSSANWLAKKTHLSTKIWLPVTIITPFLLLGLFFGYTAPKIATQASELMDRLPQAISYIQQYLAELQWAGQLADNVKSFSADDPKVSTIVDALSGFFSSTMNGLGSFIFALFLGLFLSVNPKWYINGTVTLVAPLYRHRVRTILSACGTALAGWLVAKIASMIVVGILTSLGLWALGIELALILGIIAALLSFIPNFGPFIAFIPAALVSLISGLDALLYVTVLYIAIQSVESYLLTPMLQAEISGLPPALTLFAQIALAGTFGITGILLAAPLTLTLMVIVSMLYVDDLLEAKTAEDSPQ
jgi:predicted PurR-regulated permease PerM